MGGRVLRGEPIRITSCMLRSLAAAAKRPEVQDTTIYGAGRASPKTFYRHPRRHPPAISSAIAIARADAQTILRHATDLTLRTVT